MKAKALVLLSGGLDSVYNLYRSCEEWSGEVEALFFNYGQRAYEAELKAAKKLSGYLKVSLQVIDIKHIFKGDKGALTGEREVPTETVDIDSLEASEKSAELVWVANRNGVFLNIAACVAEKKDIPFIVPGFNAEEAATFPDNSQDYIDKMNACLKFSTANQVQIQCFSQAMNKTEIVKDCLRLDVSMDEIWSCYYPGENICGKCESCQRFLRACEANQVQLS